MIEPNQSSFHEKVYLFLYLVLINLFLSQAAANQFHSNKGIIKPIIILSYPNLLLYSIEQKCFISYKHLRKKYLKGQ